MATTAGSSAEEVAILCDGTPYQVVRLLGRGGMGQVWVVRHGFLGCEFALKILHPHLSTEPRVIDRLRLEAEVTATLDHPNIVPVVDFWLTDDGRPCLVMELLSGNTLSRELFERQHLTVTEVLEIGSQVLNATFAAHRHGVLHRDIKPENIFLHELAGQARKARLLDFGVARVFRESAERPITELSEATRTGTQVGSPKYMSPEARRGAELDERADIYSIGITLYEALTGHSPFARISVSTPPIVPSALVPGVPRELDEILVQAIAVDANDRLQTAAEFESRLRGLLPARPHRVSVR